MNAMDARVMERRFRKTASLPNAGLALRTTDKRVAPSRVRVWRVRESKAPKAVIQRDSSEPFSMNARLAPV